MDRSSLNAAPIEDLHLPHGAKGTPTAPDERDPAPDLATFLRAEWPALAFGEKRQLVQSLAAHLAGAHHAGRGVRNWSAAMLRIQRRPSDWRVLSHGRSRTLPRLGRERAQMGELAYLYADLLPQVGRAWSLRFLNDYLQSPGRDVRRRWLAAVEKRALGIARRRWRRQTRLAFGDGREFIRETRGAFRIYRRHDVPPDALAALVADADGVLGMGETLFGRGHDCLTTRVVIAGQPYLLKRYECRGLWNRFRHLFRRSRGLRYWLAARAFQLRGVPLPQPCLCLEERRLRILLRSYTLTEFFEGSARLSDVYQSETEAWRRDILVRLAMVFGRLHRFGGIHGDTNWDNILIRPQGNDVTVTLVDLDGSCILPWPFPGRMVKDIWHFIRDMRRRGGDRPEEIEFFLRCWSRWSGQKIAIRLSQFSSFGMREG
jgi:hypothetical protein